jgi:hypothetical protein
MGTRGYKVYRHEGRYYVYLNDQDSYPEVLWLQVLREIPRNVSKEKFEEWVRDTREFLYDEYDSDADSDDSDDSLLPDVSYKQPENDVFIEWIYEIDLDNLVFHVDSQPLFRLDNMPPEDEFVQYISFNHFGLRAFRENTPAQFRYDWRAPPPLPLSGSLAAYNSCRVRSSTSSVHDLLDVPVALSSIECVRKALVELLVTRCMANSLVCHDVHVLESVPDRDHISQSMLELALSLVNFAVGPPIPSLPCTPYGDTCDFFWIRKDVCLRITTHLDDEDNLQASIGDLVQHINMTPEKVGTVYGIACSIFHCSLVRVDEDELGTSFAHTSALQFLPSFYARTLFTEGIEALSRLGCQASGVEFLDAISDSNNLPRLSHKELSITRSVPVAAKVSFEVWTRVGDLITSPADLVTLASISPQAMSAAAYFVRYPWVEKYRLVDVISSGPIQPIPETTADTNHKDIRCYFYGLCRAKFTAVRGGHRINVELSQSFSTTRISLEVMTYFELSRPLFIKKNELYISELDDDNAS